MEPLRNGHLKDLMRLIAVSISKELIDVMKKDIMEIRFWHMLHSVKEVQTI